MKSGALGVPKSFELNKYGGGEGLGDGVEIQIREGESYIPYTYGKESGGWLDAGFNPADKEVPIGASVWLRTAKAGVTVIARGLNN